MVSPVISHLKRPKLKFGNSPLPSAEVKNEWRYLVGLYLLRLSLFMACTRTIEVFVLGISINTQLHINIGDFLIHVNFVDLEPLTCQVE